MNPETGRSPIAVGFEWATRISVVSVAFVLPMLGGLWLDRRLGIGPVGLLVGMGLGFGGGAVQLTQLVRASSQSQSKRQSS